jgi:hypothetical protein
MSHTPGPRKAASTRVTDARNRFVASTKRLLSACVSPEEEANARLVAAAPAMLRALQQVALYSQVNHEISRDYGEVVGPAIALAVEKPRRPNERD